MRDIGNDNKGFTFKAASGSNLPYESNYFDLVIVSMVLHHVPSVEKTLSEVFAILILCLI